MKKNKTFITQYLLKSILFAVYFISGIICYAQESRFIHISSGLQLSAERDYGYSPLVYAGPGGYVSLNYAIDKQNVSNYLTMSVSSGGLKNRYGKKMNVYTGNIQYFRFYHKNKNEANKIRLGWFNNNEFSIRDNETANNFNYRSDYFTSIGPAVHYKLPLDFRGKTLFFETLGHFQLLGFKISSSYVDSGLRGFETNPNPGVKDLLNSLSYFYPGNGLNFSFWPALNFRFKTGNMLGINYRYDYISLQNSHLAEKSRSKWFISLYFNL